MGQFSVEKPVAPGSVLSGNQQQEVYETERHLLYVACTRARDHLLVSGVDPVSEFLDDFVKGDRGRRQVGE